MSTTTNSLWNTKHPLDLVCPKLQLRWELLGPEGKGGGREQLTSCKLGWLLVPSRVPFHRNWPILVLLTGGRECVFPIAPTQAKPRSLKTNPPYGGGGSYEWHCYKETYPLTTWYMEVTTHCVTLNRPPICRTPKTRSISGSQLLKHKADLQKKKVI